MIGRFRHPRLLAYVLVDFVERHELVRVAGNDPVHDVFACGFIFSRSTASALLPPAEPLCANMRHFRPCFRVRLIAEVEVRVTVVHFTKTRVTHVEDRNVVARGTNVLPFAVIALRGLL